MLLIIKYIFFYRFLQLDNHFLGGNQITLEGPLYIKIESKKAWKRYHFILRAPGIYYYPKDKTKSQRDLLCYSIFTGYEIYKGVGWKKKHKAPTDFTFALKSQTECIGADANMFQQSIKMMCAEDYESLDRWVTGIRVAIYGKRLLDNHRRLLEDLAREDLDKFSSIRRESTRSIVSSVPSQCSSDSNARTNNNNNELQLTNVPLSCASSSSSSGCLSDENNAFDSDYPTGTIKRKPSMKPNLPLTSVTRQLKEVVENTLSIELNPISLERGGTLTRRHSRRRSEESVGSNSNNSTLKRRSTTTRGSVEISKSSNSTSCTAVSQLSQQPVTFDNNINNVKNNNNTTDTSMMSTLEAMPPCMTDSMFSLPPPPEENGSFNGSTFSLETFPPPPAPSDLIIRDLSTSQISITKLSQASADNNNTSSQNYIIQSLCSIECDRADSAITYAVQSICSNSTKPSIKAPPYKSPPPYNMKTVIAMTHLANPKEPAKTVTFADSPVLLRRKISLEDDLSRPQSSNQLQSPRRSTTMKNIAAPLPPPRAEATRLSTITPTKRLSESVSNPQRDFLQDLQRVMRKKWQVAQKCKLEPTTTPHEVLGFRDFASAAAAAASGIEFQDTSHYYRKTSNVSNWVQEHYGSLYENLVTDIELESPAPTVKKRPPPPPPKRSTTTQLTNVYRT